MGYPLPLARQASPQQRRQGENSWSGVLGWRLGAGLAGWAGGLDKNSAEDRSAARLGWGAGLGAVLGGAQPLSPARQASIA